MSAIRIEEIREISPGTIPHPFDLFARPPKRITTKPPEWTASAGTTRRPLTKPGVTHLPPKKSDLTQWAENLGWYKTRVGEGWEMLIDLADLSPEDIARHAEARARKKVTGEKLTPSEKLIPLHAYTSAFLQTATEDLGKSVFDKKFWLTYLGVGATLNWFFHDPVGVAYLANHPKAAKVVEQLFKDRKWNTKAGKALDKVTKVFPEKWKPTGEETFGGKVQRAATQVHRTINKIQGEAEELHLDTIIKQTAKVRAKGKIPEIQKILAKEFFRTVKKAPLGNEVPAPRDIIPTAGSISTARELSSALKEIGIEVPESISIPARVTPDTPITLYPGEMFAKPGEIIAVIQEIGREPTTFAGKRLKEQAEAIEKVALHPAEEARDELKRLINAGIARERMPLAVAEIRETGPEIPIPSEAKPIPAQVTKGIKEAEPIPEAPIPTPVVSTAEQAKIETLLKKHKGLIDFVVSQHFHPGIEKADLIQAAGIGLMQAEKHFDPTRGIKFQTYAKHWIEGAVRKEVSQAFLIKLPREISQKISKIKNFQTKFSQTHGYNPAPEEIAKGMGITKDEVERTLSNVPLTVALESENEVLLLPERREEVLLERDEAKEKVAGFLAKLTPREREVVSAHFGIETGYPQSFDEIGKRLGITRQGTQLIVKRAVEKMRQTEKPGEKMPIGQLMFEFAKDQLIVREEQLEFAFGSRVQMEKNITEATDVFSRTKAINEARLRQLREHLMHGRFDPREWTIKTTKEAAAFYTMLEIQE